MALISKIINRAKMLHNFMIDSWYKCFYKKPTVIGIEETILELVQSDRSIARYGDGELDLIMGKDIPFQKNDVGLLEKLKHILLLEDDYFMVGIPDTFNSLDFYNESAKRYFKNYLRNYRKNWYKNLNRKEKIYYCAEMTRPYMDLADKSPSEKYFNLLRQIWKDKKVVIIEGEKSRLGIGNDLFDDCAEIKRVLCPSTNAFSVYEDILDEVAKFSKDYMILLALGPTATALAYDIYKMGYRALDIGHVDIEYEWFLMGATEKVPVKNKYTNEAESLGGLDVGESNDLIYQSQIFSKIGC